MSIKLAIILIICYTVLANQEDKQLFVEYGSGIEGYQLEAYLNDTVNGFYVDIGGYDPYIYSNSFSFYLKGWKGVVVEPNPARIQRFNIERPNEIHLNIAAGDADKILTLHQARDDSTATVSQAVSQNQTFKDYNKTINVPSLTLSQICQRYFLKPPSFMNVDTEGYGGRILQGNNWSNPNCRPEIIFCEINRLNKISGLPLPEKILEDNGYKFVDNQFKANSVFISGDLYDKYVARRNANMGIMFQKYRIIFFSQIVPILKQQLKLSTFLQYHYERSRDDVNYHLVVEGQPVHLQRINLHNNWYSNKSNKLIVVMNFNPYRQYIVLTHSNYTTSDVMIRDLKFQNITVHGLSQSFTALILDYNIKPKIANPIIIIKSQFPFLQQGPSGGKVDQKMESQLSLMEKKFSSQIANLSSLILISVIVATFSFIVLIFQCITSSKLGRHLNSKSFNGQIYVNPIQQP